MLRPDNGLYWRTTLWVYLALVVVSLGVASAFALAGFWPVLPFAGVELALLGIALYVTARRGRYREVVRVRGGTVEIEKGYDGPRERWRFERAWTRVALRKARQRLHPARLVLCCRGVTVEVGAFLTDDDRAALARELDQAVGPMASAGMLASGP